MINRRQWLYRVGVIAGAAAQPGSGFAKNNQAPQKTQHLPLDLYDFEPKSMLQVPETRVAHARFPVIDFQCSRAGQPGGPSLVSGSAQFPPRNCSPKQTAR